MTVPFGTGYGYGYPGYYSARPYYSDGYYADGGYSYPPREYSDGYHAQAPAQDQNAAEVEVRVPDPNAEVLFNGHRTNETGPRRIFRTAPLEPGYTYSYDVSASWRENGRMVTQQQSIQLQPGGRAVADFTRPGAGTTVQPADPSQPSPNNQQQPAPPVP